MMKRGDRLKVSGQGSGLTWRLQVVGAAHAVGLKSSSTIMVRLLCIQSLSSRRSASWQFGLVSRLRIGFGSLCILILVNAGLQFGHCDSPRSWARHMIALRELQSRTMGFTEFVPLPFVHMEAPIYLKGKDLQQGHDRLVPAK